jgi:hypothetical protein
LPTGAGEFLCSIVVAPSASFKVPCALYKVSTAFISGVTFAIDSSDLRI